jgi:hypothetical protein
LTSVCFLFSFSKYISYKNTITWFIGW